jgi:hypothetical protein
MKAKLFLLLCAEDMSAYFKHLATIYMIRLSNCHVFFEYPMPLE